MQIYAIGDIHGQIGMLEWALDLIEADGGGAAPVVFLGDLVDRGPDSRAVVERISRGVTDGRNWIVLKGNHDRMFHWFMEDVPRHDTRLFSGLTWLHERLGGMTTLASYGVDVSRDRPEAELHAEARALVPEAHLTFLAGNRITYPVDDLFFVHAGIRPGVPIAEQTEEDLVWIRNEFLEDTTDHGPLIVHGHSPVGAPMHAGNRVNLDSGAGFGHPLSTAVFEGRECFILSRGGRIPLVSPV